MNKFFKMENLMRLYDEMNAKYDIVPFRKQTKPGQVILRHDIDVDVKKAFDLAVIERMLGIHSTYFVLLSAPYNVWYKKNKMFLKAIYGFGHEIGLHFDPSIYSLKNSMIENIWKEKRVLEDVLGTKIYSVSIHNYSKHKNQCLVPDMINAYDPKLFNDETYWSDSRGIIKKDIYKVLEKTKEGKTVQILMHPIYYSDEGYSYETLFDESVLEYALSLYEEYRINKIYDKEIDIEDIIRRYGQHE